jgi:transposase
MAGELTEAQWKKIAPLLPPPKGRGRHRADDRRTLSGIMWVLRTGARWQDLPQDYGSDTTCHRRLQDWQREGVWERIWQVFLEELDEEGKLDWSRAFLDGTFVPAKKGARQ